jgi:hypothetical protein
VDGALEASVLTNWAWADYLEVGGEVRPPDMVIHMGPTNFSNLVYRSVNGFEYNFYYHDLVHCDVDPPMQPFNLFYPGNTPNWIHTHGPAAGGYCGTGAP